MTYCCPCTLLWDFYMVFQFDVVKIRDNAKITTWIGFFFPQFPTQRLKLLNSVPYQIVTHQIWLECWVLTGKNAFNVFAAWCNFYFHIYSIKHHISGFNRIKMEIGNTWNCWFIVLINETWQFSQMMGKWGLDVDVNLFCAILFTRLNLIAPELCWWKFHLEKSKSSICLGENLVF